MSRVDSSGEGISRNIKLCIIKNNDDAFRKIREISPNRIILSFTFSIRSMIKKVFLKIIIRKDSFNVYLIGQSQE